MEDNKEIKRLFFGFEALAPWPEKLPPGRILEASNRHATFAFLGDIHYPSLEQILPSLPLPPFRVGKVGCFCKCLFLPPRHPNVAAWEVEFYEERELLENYNRYLVQWLRDNQIPVKEHSGSFLPHVTICRQPKQLAIWKESFQQLPVIFKNFQLYESMGSSQYTPIWTNQLIAPFEELDHTADVAFLVRGESLQELHLHARVALAFLFPPILQYFSAKSQVNGIDDIVIDLNDIVMHCDRDVGCPFKAVSFHGEITEENQILSWEMIIDV